MDSSSPWNDLNPAQSTNPNHPPILRPKNRSYRSNTPNISLLRSSSSSSSTRLVESSLLTNSTNRSSNSSSTGLQPPPLRAPPCPFPFSGPSCQTRGVCWGRQAVGGAGWSADGMNCQCSISWLFRGPPRCQTITPEFVGCVAGVCVLLVVAMVLCNAKQIREWYFEFQLKEICFEDHMIATNPLAAFLPDHDYFVHDWKAQYQAYQARRRSSQSDFNMRPLVGGDDDLLTRESVTIDLLRGRECKQYSVAKGLSRFAPTALLMDIQEAGGVGNNFLAMEPELYHREEEEEEETTKFTTLNNQVDTSNSMCSIHDL